MVTAEQAVIIEDEEDIRRLLTFTVREMGNGDVTLDPQRVRRRAESADPLGVYQRRPVAPALLGLQTMSARRTSFPTCHAGRAVDARRPTLVVLAFALATGCAASNAVPNGEVDGGVGDDVSCQGACDGGGAVQDSGGADSHGDAATCSGTCYTVTASATHASSAPTGAVRVSASKTQSFTVKADSNYELSSSSPLTAQGTCPAGTWSSNVFQTGVLEQAVYTTGPITADCNVSFLATSAIVQVPDAANATNVTASPYNADKSGNCANATATTAAFNQAIADAFQQDGDGNNYTYVVYVPAGTYCINGPINPGPGVSSVTIQGAGVGQTIIQLADNSGLDGAVLTIAGDADQPSCDRNQTGAGDGACNTAFRNDINDLTINTGTHNPNATGVIYLANNNGEVRNVSIVSGDGSGVVGFDGSTFLNGPALVKNLYVQGFSTGVSVVTGAYSLDFEHLQLKDQQSVGVDVSTTGVVTIRDLESSQSVSGVAAVQSQDPNNVLTIIDHPER